MFNVPSPADTVRGRGRREESGGHIRDEERGGKETSVSIASLSNIKVCIHGNDAIDLEPKFLT